MKKKSTLSWVLEFAGRKKICFGGSVLLAILGVAASFIPYLLTANVVGQLAIIMFVTGMGYLGAPLIILVGVIADLIARSVGYKSFKKTVISNGIFSLWICANYFPVVITADSYRKDLIDGSYSAEYCNNLFGAINYKTIAVLLILCSQAVSARTISGSKCSFLVCKKYPYLFITSRKSFYS